MRAVAEIVGGAAAGVALTAAGVAGWVVATGDYPGGLSAVGVYEDGPIVGALLDAHERVTK